jgi:hypothetical protein
VQEGLAHGVDEEAMVRCRLQEHWMPLTGGRTGMPLTGGRTGASSCRL